VELDLDTTPVPADSRSTTPIPFWLRTGDEVPPPLVLPPSSEDLLISSDLVLKACSTYEVLRHYRLLLRLSPFRFEDFCAALVLISLNFSFPSSIALWSNELDCFSQSSLL
jgi:DDT domain